MINNNNNFDDLDEMEDNYPLLHNKESNNDPYYKVKR